MPSITVILPVLNGMPYIREALASLEAQTLRDFEVLLWDNGSTDGTVEEAQSWIPSRLPGRVVTGEPLPLHLCLARMVTESRTEFCARMDADDLCLPHRFEWQLDYLRAHPEIALVGGQMERIDTAGKSLGPVNYPTDSPGVLLGMLWHNPLPHPAISFRRDAVLAAGNYTAQKPVEDLDLWLRMAIRGDRMANLPDKVLGYRQHEASVCHGYDKNGELWSIMSDCFARHAPELFGLDTATHLSLLWKAHPRAVVPLEKALRRIAERTGLSVWKLRQRSDYHRAGRRLTAKNDVVTRIYLRLLEPLFNRK